MGVLVAAPTLEWSRGSRGLLGNDRKILATFLRSPATYMRTVGARRIE
jgi:hypothetical protein